MQTQKYYSHGKLLITGEYVVLDGAEALALPSKFGQSLNIKPIEGRQFEWTSYLKNGEVWQHVKFNIDDFRNPSTSDKFESRLFQILNVIYQSNPNLFSQTYAFSTQLEFDKDWGLGSSSTLISNLAEWAQIDAYELLAKTFGGSGYDIAAAKMHAPFIYQRTNKQIFTTAVKIHDKLRPHIYFVYLNQKQNSREAIKAYRKIPSEQQKNTIDKISKIAHKIINTSDLYTFERLLKDHEQILSDIINQKTIQDLRFKDYQSGIVKSLGAWGGDFVLVTAKHQGELDYFKAKGYDTIYAYEELIY